MPRFRRPSHGTVAAYSALFIALGGTSYAAINLPADSVGSLQLKTDAVTRSKIHSNAVTSSKVKNGSLLAGDFRSGSLPAGPAGPTGPAGPAGPAGSARAYGRIDSNGVVDTPRSKNIASVTKPFTGVYCITPGAGIDANTTGVVATPDPHGAYFKDQDADVEWDSLRRDCPAGTFEINVFVNGGNNASLDSGADTYQRYSHVFADGPFFFVIP